MGMYSTFQQQEIEVTDPEGVQAIKKIGDYKNVDNVITEEGVEFEKWDEGKVYGYLSLGGELVRFLKTLARFVKGYVEFEYEEGFKYRFVFKDKKVFLQTEPTFEGWDTLLMEALK